MINVFLIQDIMNKVAELQEVSKNLRAEGFIESASVLKNKSEQLMKQFFKFYEQLSDDQKTDHIERTKNKYLEFFNE